MLSLSSDAPVNRQLTQYQHCVTPPSLQTKTVEHIFVIRKKNYVANNKEHFTVNTSLSLCGLGFLDFGIPLDGI